MTEKTKPSKNETIRSALSLDDVTREWLKSLRAFLKKMS